MKSFDIEITETLQRTVSVIADSREEAEQMVDDGWHNGDYVLDSEDFIDVDFKTVGEKEMSKDKKELDVLLVKPGDLVFFSGTYDTPGMSHCGIYLGNGMMVSAGDPIKYANIHSSYWQKYLAGFGRLSK